MATNNQITKVLNSLGQFPECPSCGVRMRFGDQECPRCGDDMYDDLWAWAEALIDDIIAQDA
ncbi:MAG: hypothetical protein J4O02_03570 [Chloroflexi bacterium]|nr:hypothetical protein [Chloroflexota bacterium]